MVQTFPNTLAMRMILVFRQLRYNGRNGARRRAPFSLLSEHRNEALRFVLLWVRKRGYIREMPQFRLVEYSETVRSDPKPAIPDEISAPRYVINRYVFVVSGAELLVPNDSSLGLSEEHSFYSCCGLVLHVWKNMSISVQREGRAGVSELLRNNFWRHSRCQRDWAAEWRKSYSLIRGTPAMSSIDLNCFAR